MSNLKVKGFEHAHSLTTPTSHNSHACTIAFNRTGLLPILTIQFYDTIGVPEGVLGHACIGTEIRHGHTPDRQTHHDPVLCLIHSRMVLVIC